MEAWIFRIIPEFRILRLTFHTKSEPQYRIILIEAEYVSFWLFSDNLIIYMLT